MIILTQANPMKLIDLTGTLEPGMWHYDSIPDMEISPLTRIEKDGSEAHAFKLATIIGTYLETAAHHFHGEPTIDEIPVERFIVPAVILRIPCTGGTPISQTDLEAAATGISIHPGDALIFATGWEKKWNQPDFISESPFLSLEAMNWIVAHRISILGGDIPCFDNPNGGAGVNRVLFRSGALILAPLVNLGAVTQSKVRLMAFPLKIKGVCATPCRVIVDEDYF
jgi:kynurenine formamidase